jgi:nucleoside-diphosphate-sugar epimerase
VGRTLKDSVTEETPCRPTIGYGITKLKIERAIIEAAGGFFDAVILRPAAVFGPEGKNLEKLTDDLTAGRQLRNYVRSCLFGNRRMNLVAVANVVAAILFLIDREGGFSGEIFNISDSDSRLNNFFDVERILMRELDLADSYLPRIALPQSFLKLALKLRGRDGINPQSDFSCEKLLGHGFKRPVDFETALIDYAAWYARNRRGLITSTSA